MGSTRRQAGASAGEAAASPPAAADPAITKEQLIAALMGAAQARGQGRLELVRKTGLWSLFFDREEEYPGAVADLPNLDDDERAAVQAALGSQPAGTLRQTGRTTTFLNLRAGPSTDFAILTTLPPDTLLQILEEQGVWLRVQADGREGCVHRDFVARDPAVASLGFLRSQADLAGAPLAPPAGWQVSPPLGVADGGLLRAVETWNRYGGLLAVLAYVLGIDPTLAAAVLAVESGGRAFGPGGRMVIRFEVHTFFDRWGVQQPDRFARHFQFDLATPWEGHRFRPDPGQPWRPVHTVDQAGDWEAFDFASRQLDDTAAKLALGMGAPQIMGFNYSAIGYEAVQQMFDAFSADERHQVMGFFDFVQGGNPNSRAVRALQAEDLLTFAAIYNGGGRAEEYKRRMEKALVNLRQLRAGVAPSTALAEAPLAAGEIALAEAVPAAIFGTVEEELPQPAVDQALKEQDPELYAAWRKHVERGFEQNATMFKQVLDAFMGPYHTTVSLYRLLFYLGVASFVVAVALSVWTRQAMFGLVFGGLSVAAFVSYFFNRPLHALEENLQFITWLGLIYNTYWTRLLYIMDRSTAQQDLEQANQDAIQELERLIDKHAERRGKRPGLR
jgi:hypothetical protein